MTLDTLPVLDMLADHVVELANVILFAYMARLGSDYLKYRLDRLGRSGDLFVPRVSSDLPEPDRGYADRGKSLETQDLPERR